jgi:hypothetical protein
MHVHEFAVGVAIAAPPILAAFGLLAFLCTRAYRAATHHRRCKKGHFETRRVPARWRYDIALELPVFHPAYDAEVWVCEE